MIEPASAGSFFWAGQKAAPGPHGTIPPPMFVLFEEAGKFQAGRVLSEAEASAQVELDSGKRVKVKSANVLLRFEKPSPAELMRAVHALDPSIEFMGAGGPRMQPLAAGPFDNWIAEAGVLGLWDVLKHYGYFRAKFHAMLDDIARVKPAAVLLVDYPGFNLRLAKALRKRQPGLRIFYYVSPQVWAWNRGRIKKMARFIDLVLCIFPFEADLYALSGLRAVFVGHPMIERLGRQKIDTRRDENLIGLFPGSRSREVRKILPIMIESARRLLQASPTVRFQVAAASEELAHLMREMLRAEQLADRETIEIAVGQTAAIMQRAFVGMVASGSATLEAAYFGMPFVLIYKVAWPTYVAGRFVVNVEFLGMPNLLAGKEVVPEFIQHEAKPDAIVDAVRLLMEDLPARARMISDFEATISKLGGIGASEKAAQAILAELDEGKSPDRRGGMETASPWSTR